MLRIIYFILFILINKLNAQEVWSLDLCMTKGLDLSYDYQIKSLEQIQSQKLKQNYLHQLAPKISTSANHAYEFGLTIDPFTNTRVSSSFQYDFFSLNASINLLDFEQLSLNKRTKLNQNFANIEKKQAEHLFQKQLIDLYFQALYLQERVLICEKQITNGQSLYDRIKQEVDLGNRPKADVYDLEFGLSQDELRLQETKNQFHLALLQLFQWIYHTDVDLKNIKLNLIVNQDIEIFKDNTAELESVKWNIQNNILQQLKSRNKPSLTAYYRMFSFYSTPLNMPELSIDPFWTQLKNNQNQSVGLQLSVPFFSGINDSKSILREKINLNKQKIEWDKAIQDLENKKQIENEKIIQQKIIVEKHETLLKSITKTYQTTLDKFEVAQVEAQILNNVENQKLDANFEYVKAKLMIDYFNLQVKFFKQK